jgi:hypothetical protein
MRILGFTFLLMVALPYGLQAQPASPTPRPTLEPSTEKEAGPVGPAVPLVEFERNAGLPPMPKGRKLTNRPLDVKADPDMLTDERVASVRALVAKDARVKAALGSRFAFLHAGQVDAEKGASSRPSRRPIAVRFYSYSRNRAVRVITDGEKVTAVVPMRAGFQPPTSPEEVAAAAEVVRRDPRYQKDLADLFVRGIVTPGTAGHRHLHLLFFKAKGLARGPAVYHIEMDVTGGKVVLARRPKE